LHQLFGESRVNPKREFFQVDPEKVVLALSIGNFKEVTPGVAIADQEEQHALDKAKSRRPRIKLDALGIKPGAVLTFSRDEATTGTVVEGSKVLYQQEVLSLSAAAVKVLTAWATRLPSQAALNTGSSRASCLMSVGAEWRLSNSMQPQLIRLTMKDLTLRFEGT
jgi:hypothetical protein